MNRTIVLFLITFVASGGLNSFAQSESPESTLDISADLVTRYIWRGMSLSTSPAIQPSLSVSSGGLTAGAWGSYTLTPEPFQEVDLYATYEVGFFSFTLYDYYNPADTLGFADDYFDWSSRSTRHTLEGILTLSGPEKFPAYLTAGIMFFGNDRNEKGENLYSTYFEFGYYGAFRETELIPFIGLTPAEGYYGNGFGVVNLGVTATRNISITPAFSIPLSTSMVVNPKQEKVYLVASITL